MSNYRTDRIIGWRLAQRVASSELYAELSDIERAECNELLARGSPADLAASERPLEGVPCRLARCNYKADCVRIGYCQAAILQAKAYREFLRLDVLPTLRTLADVARKNPTTAPLANELGSLAARANRIV